MTAENVRDVPVAVQGTHWFKGRIALGLRAGVIACGVLLTFSIGATTVETVTNRDPGLCEAFGRMVHALSLPSLSRAQLCALRFASLPAASTGPFGFTFPNWQVFSEADPVAAYTVLVEEHMNTSARETDTPELKMAAQRELARQGDEVARLGGQGNLLFRRSDITVSGQELTFVQVDWLHCPVPDTRYMGPLVYASYLSDDPRLRKPVPGDSSPLAAELAIWRGSTPVAIEVVPPIKDVESHPYIFVTTLWWRKTGRKREENGALGGRQACVFRVDA